MTYDQTTLDQLFNRHGLDRTTSIALGHDPATNADRAAWARLGGLTLTTKTARLAKALRLIDDGVSREHVQMLYGLSKFEMNSAIMMHEAKKKALPKQG